jgi:hypothetical protein
MNNPDTSIKTYASDHEQKNRDEMLALLERAPIPRDQLLSNIGLFIESKNLARILFMDHLFKQIVEVPGAILEFGTRWGQNLALFSALRGIYDPFNRHRRIIGFDTFTGFPSVRPEDGASDMIRKGNLATTENYEQFLRSVLSAHEKLNPLSHLTKHDLRVGDSTVEVKRFLDDEPHTIVALAYFDFDLFEPTKACLEAVRPRLVKGSVIGFDELNDPDSPGETLGLMEAFGLNNIRLKRFRYASRVSYFIVE